MKTSKLALREARQLFRSCRVNGLLDESRARQALARLSERQPRGYMQILERFHRLVKLDMVQRAVRVESATPLPADLQNGIAQQITAKYGQGMNMSFTQNSALIGGLRIQAGSDLYDGSVKTRLEKLEESF
ncbi:MAG TPA: F0F1 ATP synthase subunit delta [Verrucomicrobiae bacterium]|nr:F0F1 ATP synthase subunit delta [Verrucomicrobiae bacterium]